MKNVVGEVTEPQRDEILRLHERRNGLHELLMCIGEDESCDVALRERASKDLDDTEARYSRWWAATAERYGWPSAPNGKWELDFATRQVFLVHD